MLFTSHCTQLGHSKAAAFGLYRLLHVVLETTNKTELIQSLGRKRRKPGEQLSVYVRAASQSTLNFRLQKVNEWLRVCDRGFRSSSKHPDHDLLLTGWADPEQDHRYAQLLVPRASGGFYVRLTAYHALLWQQGTLRKLLRMGRSYGDNSALPRLVHSWLEDPDGYREENWLSHNTQQTKRLALIEYPK